MPRHPPQPPLTVRQKYLVARNIWVAYWIARQYAVKYPNLRRRLPDLRQAACLGLMRAAQLYDPARAKFSTYGSRWARSAICRLLYRRKRRVEVIPVSAIRKADHDGDCVTWHEDAQPMPEEQVMSREGWDGLLCLLSPKLRPWAELFWVQSCNLTEAGQRMGVTRERARQRHNQILYLIEKRLGPTGRLSARLTG